MPVTIDDLTLDPLVFLAPMAGITDVPFRRIVAGFGAGLVVSEMVASREMVTARASVRAKAEASGVLEAVQIAGCEAHWIAECARLCEAEGARIIDINMGCPAKKVTNGYSGSALMRDPDHALSLIEAVVGTVSVPVTVKMRLGWDEASLNAPEIARRAEAAGVRMVTVHGRTRCQFYKGIADWDAIAAVKQAVSVPVIANGDIVDTCTARRALASSGADGVMVGRGVQGRPWILAEIAAGLTGATAPNPPEGWALISLIVAHYEAMLAFHGTDLGARCARKHLGWYLDRIAGTGALRRRVLTERDPRAVVRLLEGLGHEVELAA